MKNTFSIFLIAIILYSCTPNNLVPEQFEIVGTWVDTISQKVYRTVDGQIDSLIIKDSKYHFLADGTFTTDNDILPGMNSGNWTFDKVENKINFTPKPTITDSLFESFKTYTWHINNVDENMLDVIYHHTDDRILPSGNTIDIKINRYFIRQQ